MKLRVKFSKHGRVKYIGHLDILRYFQKALRRAEFDLRFTEGFSPHPIMSFAAPLGVGIESEGEYMDIEVNSVSDSRTMVMQLEKEMTEGIHIIGIWRLPDSAKNAMASVAAATYVVTSENEGMNYEPLVKKFMDSSEIIYCKELKSGIKEWNIKPHVYQLEATRNKVTMQVDASSASNLKPLAVISTLHNLLGEEDNAIDPDSFRILRLETYAPDENLAQEQLSFCGKPLWQLGEDF